MYTPAHLEWLDRTQKDNRGWPVFITEEGKDWCLKMLRRGFQRFGQMDLELARRCIWNAEVCGDDRILRPDCLCTALWDAQYGVTHRALLELGADQFFRLDSADASDALLAREPSLADAVEPKLSDKWPVGV